MGRTKTNLFFFLFRCTFLLTVVVNAAADSGSHRPDTDDLDDIYGENWKHKPGYHYRPNQNWINDPNGPMYWNGYYHLFYQYSLNDTEWGDIVWAHAISTDLVTWTDLNHAIFPSKPFDQEGCWSGSATIIPGEGPVIFYTGLDLNQTQVQNLAYPTNVSDPYLREWNKPDFNPVIFPYNDSGINASSFRDPTTAWRGQDGLWRTVVGSRRDHRGLAVLYRSKDFRTWVQAKHPLHSVVDVGMWECPDFFPVSTYDRTGLVTSAIGNGTKHVFKVSLDSTRYDYYTLGKYHSAPGVDTFLPDLDSVDDHSGLRYDYGNFYASKSFYDINSKRRILWGWSNESDTKAQDAAKGWSGIQLIPRSVWLDEGGKQLVQWPVEELNRLRTRERNVRELNLHIGSVYQLEGFHTSQADVEVEFYIEDLEKADPFDPKLTTDPQLLCVQNTPRHVGGVGPFGLMLLASSDLKERTVVYFKVFKDGDNKHKVLMCHDSSSSSFMGDVWRPTYGAFVDANISKDKTISLRNLIDNSVVESFAEGGKTCMSSRVYPTIAYGRHTNMYAFNNGTSNIQILELKAWHMNPPKINYLI